MSGVVLFHLKCVNETSKIEAFHRVQKCRVSVSLVRAHPSVLTAVPLPGPWLLLVSLSFQSMTFELYDSTTSAKFVESVWNYMKARPSSKVREKERLLLQVTFRIERKIKNRHASQNIRISSRSATVRQNGVRSTVQSRRDDHRAIINLHKLRIQSTEERNVIAFGGHTTSSSNRGRTTWFRRSEGEGGKGLNWKCRVCWWTAGDEGSSKSEYDVKGERSVESSGPGVLMDESRLNPALVTSFGG